MWLPFETENSTNSSTCLHLLPVVLEKLLLNKNWKGTQEMGTVLSHWII